MLTELQTCKSTLEQVLAKSTNHQIKDHLRLSMDAINDALTALEGDQHEI